MGYQKFSEQPAALEISPLDVVVGLRDGRNCIIPVGIFSEFVMGNNLAQAENDVFASKAYAVDDFLVFRGVLYKVTQPIAQGEQLVINTNIVHATLADDMAAHEEDKNNPHEVTAAQIEAIPEAARGVAGGVAELDSEGKVPSEQLPPFVDDVLDYSSRSAFPQEGAAGVIYIADDTNLLYRWATSDYAQIGVVLGETSTTAYRGDRGKTAYDHSQVTSGNPHQVTKTEVGLSNVANERQYSAENKPSPSDIGAASQTDFSAHTGDTDNPHQVTKSQVGLGNVENERQYSANNKPSPADLGAVDEEAVADEYDSTATYVVGQYAYHENTLYRCTTAITVAEAWNAEHWTIAVLGDDVSGHVNNKSNPHGVTTAQIGAIPATEKGAANGVAELGADGRVPSEQLPSYVDDIVEVATYSDLPATGEAGKIYVTLDTNLTYRWGGTEYVEVSQSLALGETSSTAYRGDRGKAAYDHSLVTSGNPHQVTKSDVGLSNVANVLQYSADNKPSPADIGAAAATDLAAHEADTSNPHEVTKSQVGLGNVADVLQYSVENKPTPADIGAASAIALTDHTSNTNNPHSVTAAQAGALGNSSVASVESGYTASKNYTAGDLIVVGSTIYEATQSIASGEILAVGTNIAATTLEVLLEAKQDMLTFDAAPTENSTNPVTSGGVYVALQGKADNDILASVEASAIASKAYSIGDYMILNGVLYVVASDIAEGGAITVGGNIVAEVLTDEFTANAKTASGPIASFAAMNTLPLRALTVGIEPVQDLHGYDYPWPAGGGANQFNPSAWVQLGNNPVYYSVSGEEVTVNADDLGGISNRLISVVAGEQYSVLITGDFSEVKVFNASGSSIGSVTATRKSTTFTAPGNGMIAIKFYANSYPTSGKLTLVKSATVPTAWTPYSNICPITGWTGANVWRTGKNLFDGEWESGYYDIADGSAVSSDLWQRSKNPIPCLPSTRYFALQTAFNSALGYFLFYDASGNYISSQAMGSGIAYTGSYVDSPANAYYINMYRRKGNNGIPFCINYPSTATAYAPYTGTTIPITWQSTAGTVYGGTVDVLAGKLRVTHAEVDLGTLTWSYYSGAVSYFHAGILGMNAANYAITHCSVYKPVHTGGMANMPDYTIRSYAATVEVVVRDSRYTDADSFKTAVTGQTCVYELATPIEYDLTASQLDTLLGTNVVWSDVGPVDVEYRAGANALLSDIPPIDATPTQNSTNTVSSAGVYTALQAKQDASTAVTDVEYANAKLTKTVNGTAADVMSVDASPTASSTNPVQSGGVYTALTEKADDTIIAPVESSTSAHNYSIGSLLIMGGVLYKVTATIATGETITPGTNVAATTIEALIESQAEKTGTITLTTTWTGTDPYTQTVTVSGAAITAKSKVDLQPTAAQLAQLVDDGVTAMVCENNSGTLTVTAMGEKPSVAMTMQVTVKEVG